MNSVRKESAKCVKTKKPLTPQGLIGTTGKVGRGGGPAAKRTLNAPQINRTGRPPMGGGPRGRVAAPSPPISAPSASSMQVEESFSLVRENPLNFGMAIKLPPGLAEEIKRVEAQGGGARIKFDVNPNNPNGNVIRVGDKVFRFTSSREPGDLCDVYEERESGDDGNKLLVESGSTWRKLNVERELDQSTRNQVKRRSEEAERKHKSRMSIVLDPQNPSIKNKVKTAAAESNTSRNFTNQKEPPSKKAKLNPPPGGLPPKPAYITGLSTTTLSKGKKISSGSPLPSQPDQNGGPVSSFGSGNLVKGHVDITSVASTQNTNKFASSDKEKHNRLPNSTIREKSKLKRNTEANPTDLKSLVVSLLQEHHPTGMSIIALKKATGDVMPNSTQQIQPILKQVAIYQSPGKYFLKSAVEKDRLNKQPSQNGRTLPQDTSFPKRKPPNGEEENKNSPLLHTMDITEKIDIQPKQHSTSGNSDSGSDSDSSSSDSDSESHSRSRNSDSDSSISSKQAPDEEVDIMSYDDKDSSPKKRKLEMISDSSQPVPGTISSPKKMKIEMNSDSSNNVTADSGVKLPPQVSEAADSDVLPMKASAKSIRPPDYIGAVSQHNKISETSAKTRFADDAGPVQARPQITNGSEKQKSIVVDNSNGRRIDSSLTSSNDGVRKENGSSSDENSYLYAKYEKEEPELKGPIKDDSMYKEYVKEYQEKYECYCSLNKIMEAYRDEFGKLGKDLEAYKVTDTKRYNDTVKQIRTSYHQCGERHKRQKKIFVILHEELKHLKQMLKDYAALCG